MKKYIKWIVLGFFILTTIFLIKLPSIVQNIAISRLEIILGRKVSSGKIKYNYARNILYMEDFNIFEDDKETVFAAFESLNVNLDTLFLFRRIFYVKELTFVKPTIRIMYNGDIPNYESIIKQLEDEKKEETISEEDNNSGFIKKFQLKDLTIESFTLFYEDKVITAENNFTFETPELLYQDNTFTLGSTLDFYDKGKVDFDLKYNNKGIFQGKFQTIKLLLDDKLYITKSIFDLSKVQGTVDSTITFSGNISTNEYSFNGSIDANNLEVTSNKQGELFVVDKLKGKLDISLADNRFYFNDIEIFKGNIELEQIFTYLDSISKEEELEDENKKELDLKVGSVEVKDININSKRGKFSEIDGSIKNFTGKIQNEFPLDINFVYNDETNVGIKSVNTLVKGLDIGKDTILSNGSFSLTGNNLDFIRSFLSEDRDYDFQSGKVDYNGEYTYSYPNIRLINNFATDSIVLDNLISDYPNITSKNFNTSNNFDYNIEDNSYKLSGSINLEDLYISNSMEEDLISSSFLSADIIEINKNTYDLANLELDTFSLDLQKLAPKEDNSGTEDNLYPNFNINNLNIKNSNIIDTNYNLGINFNGTNIGIREGNSNINFDGSYNNSPITLVGTLIKPIELTESSTLDSVTFKGNTIITNFNLEDINIYTDNKYNLEGTLTLKSDINYSKNNIVTTNNVASSFSAQVNQTSLQLNDLISDNNIVIKNGRTSFKGDININNTQVITKDNNTTLDRFQLETNATLFNDDITSTNILKVFKISNQSKDSTFETLNFSSDNNFNMKDDKYSLNGKFNIKYTSIDLDDTNITLNQGDLVVKNISPKEILIENLSLISPRISISEDNDNTAPSKTNDVDIKKAADEKEKAEKENPLVYIKTLDIQKGRVDYSSKDLKYHLKNILINLKGFTTEANKDFTGNISSGLTGAGSFTSDFTSSLERTWDFKPTSFNIDGDFKISNLNLLDFKNYFKTRLPNEITSGKLSYTGEVKLKNGKFRGENLISVDTIYIGNETSVDSAIPLKLAVGILKDRKGNLELDVPVSGDFNDPKFRIYRVVLQAIKNILIKAVTSPVNILSKAFNLGTDETIALEYNYLETTPKLGDKTLEKIADILKERRNIDIIFTIFTNSDEEKRVLNESIRENQVFKRNTKDEKLEEKLAEIMSQRKDYIENYFDRILLSRRIRVEVSDIPRDNPRSSVDIVINE